MSRSALTMSPAFDAHQPITGNRRSAANRSTPACRLATTSSYTAWSSWVTSIGSCTSMTILAGSGMWPNQSVMFKPHGSATEIGVLLSRSTLSSIEQPGQPLPASEEQRRLLAADAGHWNDRHGGLAGESHEAVAAAEVDDMSLPRWAVHLVVAARIHQHGGAGLKGQPGVFGTGRHGAELAEPAQHRVDGDKVVRELVERPLDTKVGAERQGEHEAVRGNVAAAVVAHQQHRPFRRNAMQSTNVGPEVQGGEHPHAWQLVSDVVRVTLVQIRLGDPGDDLLPGPFNDVRHTRHSSTLAQVGRFVKVFAPLGSEPPYLDASPSNIRSTAAWMTRSGATSLGLGFRVSKAEPTIIPIPASRWPRSRGRGVGSRGRGRSRSSWPESVRP